MNDLDHAAQVLGPQLLKGRRPVELTKGKQADLANWATKLALMLPHTHRREDRYIIPESDYTDFYLHM